MSKYPNLPGIDVSIADGGLILPEDATTQSMLILAHSLESGAPKEPVLTRQSSDLVANGFGDFLKNGQVNPIAQAWKAAFEGGNRRIYLMAIGGTTDVEKFTFVQDSLFGILADFPVDHVVLAGIHADKEVTFTTLPTNKEGVIHEFFIQGSAAITFPLTITTGTNDVIQLVVDSVATKITLSGQEYADATALEQEIVSELTNANLAVTAEVKNNVLKLVSAATFTLEVDAAISTANASLKLPSGTSTTADVVATEKKAGNFALLLGQYAENQTLNLGSTIAYIGTSAPSSNSLTDIKVKVDALVAIENEFSGYVQVVAGPELGYVVPGKNELVFTNGVVSYAALVSTLRPESAPTQKRLYGVAGVHYQLSLRQLNALTGNKFVTFRVKNNQVIVTDGITTAPDYYVGGVKRSSDFTRLSTLRITQAASELVRDICEPFIGEPNRMPQYNAMNASIKGGLEAMRTAGAINDFRFTVTSSGATLNQAVVTLEIVPAFELRKVTVNVSLRPNFLS